MKQKIIKFIVTLLTITFMGQNLVWGDWSTVLRPRAQIDRRTLPKEILPKNILLDEQRWIEDIIVVFENRGIYRDRKLNKPPFPVLKFEGLDNEEKCAVSRNGDALELTFDLRHIGDEEELIALYWQAVSPWYFDHIAQIHDRDRYVDSLREAMLRDPSYLKTRYKEYITRCGIREGDAVLDIGTYSGWMAILAGGLTKNTVIGVDIAKEAIAQASENARSVGAENVKFLQGNALYLDQQFPPASIDVLIADNLFCYVPPRLRAKVLLNMLRTAKRRINILEYADERTHIFEGWKMKDWMRELRALGLKDDSFRISREDGFFFIQIYLERIKPGTVLELNPGLPLDQI